MCQQNAKVISWQFRSLHIKKPLTRETQNLCFAVFSANGKSIDFGLELNALIKCDKAQNIRLQEPCPDRVLLSIRPLSLNFPISNKTKDLFPEEENIVYPHKQPMCGRRFQLWRCPHNPLLYFTVINFVLSEKWCHRGNVGLWNHTTHVASVFVFWRNLSRTCLDSQVKGAHPA